MSGLSEQLPLTESLRSVPTIPTQQWRRVAVRVLLVAILATIAYFPALSGDFIWDDDTYVTNNPLIKFPGQLHNIWFSLAAPDYYPVSNTSLWLDWRLWGLNSTGYHVINLLLHVIAALIIWPILQQLSIPGGFLAALLFAVHPVNVESVAWIAQRKGLLAMIFFLLAVLCYLRHDEHDSNTADMPPDFTASRRWYWLSLLAFLLAMLSKGAITVLPGILLGIVWWQHGKVTWRDVRKILPFFVLAVALTVVNIWFQTHGSGEVIRTGSLAQRLAGAGNVVWFYLANSLLPINLMFVYPDWNIQTERWIWWAPAFAFLIVTGVLWWQRKSSWARSLLLAWGYFCLSLLPVMGFTFVYFMKYSLVADHYAYTALVGVVVFLAASWSRWNRTARGAAHLVSIAAATIVVALFTGLTYRQCVPYSDLIHLYSAALEKNPGSEMLHDNLGVVFANTGKHREAIVQFESALRLDPTDFDAHNNLGLEFIAIGRIDDGLREIRESLRLNPDFPLAHNALGSMLFDQGRYDEAIQEFRQAVQSDPRLAEALNNLGKALAKSGRVEESFQYFQRAISVRPDFAEAYNNFALALLLAGYSQPAMERLQDAIRFRPDDPRAWSILAQAYAQLNQSDNAIAAARKAISLAQAAGKQDFARQVADWLRDYQSASGTPAR